MRVVLCGVRGSTPAPGPQYVRYGGHTSCVALAHDGDAPSLILDGGTGLRRLSSLLGDEPFAGTILLGHLHWDHTQGLPFFRAGARSGARVRVLLPQQGDAEEVLGRAFSPPHFPVRPSELGPAWSFDGLEAGGHEIEGFTVTAADIPHRGGRTFGFRVSDGSGTVAYLSDHSPLVMGPGPDGLGEYHAAALTLASAADVLLHDAQHTAAELPARSYLGHSAVEYAIGLGETAGVRRVLLFHHDPDRTDEELAGTVAAHRHHAVPVHAAAETTSIDLGGGAHGA